MSYALEYRSFSYSPCGFVKCVSSSASDAAFSFMRSTNFACVPLIPSAIAIAASLPDGSSSPYSRSSSDNSMPGLSPITVEPVSSYSFALSTCAVIILLVSA